MRRIRFLFILLLLATSFNVGAQTGINVQQIAYINKYKDLAIEQMHRHGIPASITLAQGILESRAGLSDLATKGNNHFGIKCHGWAGRTVYHDDDESQECFRAYNSARESYEDHSMFLVRSARYKQLFQLKPTDYKGWAYGLKACGYATNPRYAYSLIELIERYNLHDFDTGKRHSSGYTQQTANNAQEHRIYIYNKNLYVVARKGDTFKSLATELDMSYRKLARINERNKDDVLAEGDIVYLKKKQNKALRQFKNQPHTVAPGESIYSIAQKYGIRLKAIYKKNNLTPEHQLRVGEKLKVY